MKTRSSRLAYALLFFPLLVASGPLHIEVTASFPDEDQELSAPPTEIWLQFSVVPDMEQTSFSVRGPEGSVELGEIEVGEDPTVIKAEVSAPIGSGAYTVSWVGAAPDDHAERGRYAFSIDTGR